MKGNKIKKTATIDIEYANTYGLWDNLLNYKKITKINSGDQQNLLAANQKLHRTKMLKIKKLK